MDFSNMPMYIKQYPTEKEYHDKIDKMRSDELNSEKYLNAFKFLSENYWDRKNIDLEDKLFAIIDNYGIEEEMYDKSDMYKKSVRSIKYEILKQFLNSLTMEQIESNLFLRSAWMLIDISNKVCSDIMTELYNKTYDKEVLNPTFIEIPIPKNMIDIIHFYINKTIGVKYYDPKRHFFKIVNILDKQHRSVYEDYDEVIEKGDRLAETICFLTINNWISNNKNISCDNMQISHPGFDNHITADFWIKPNDVDISLNEYIDNSICDFEKLVNFGVVDVETYSGYQKIK